MKNLVRAFVITLFVTGTVASFQSSTMTTAAAQASRTKTDGRFPIPMCPPSDPNACGIGNRN